MAGEGPKDELSELTDEQQQIIRQNLERAKRLRFLKSQPHNKESPATGVDIPGRGGFFPSSNQAGGKIKDKCSELVNFEPRIINLAFEFH